MPELAASRGVCDNCDASRRISFAWHPSMPFRVTLRHAAGPVLVALTLAALPLAGQSRATLVVTGL
jgi:hypothetical protein